MSGGPQPETSCCKVLILHLCKVKVYSLRSVDLLGSVFSELNSLQTIITLKHKYTFYAISKCLNHYKVQKEVERGNIYLWSPFVIQPCLLMLVKITPKQYDTWVGKQLDLVSNNYTKVKLNGLTWSYLFSWGLLVNPDLHPVSYATLSSVKLRSLALFGYFIDIV